MEYGMEELLPIVQGLVEKYTFKESASVSYEKAQQLMEAVMYCINEIDIYNKEHEKEKYELLNQNSKMPAQEAYQHGYELCVEKFMKANSIYVDIIKDFRDYHNMAYHDTIVDGLSGFFKYYDPKFEPQNHIITMDYPILENLYGINGIDAIYRYIIAISMEQTFLSIFSVESIVNVLISYHNKYEELLINIGSIILRKLLVNIILGKRKLDEELTLDDYLRIQNMILSSERKCIEDKMEELLQEVVKRGYNNNRELFEYLRNDIPDFVSELINAANYGSVKNIFSNGGV